MLALPELVEDFLAEHTEVIKAVRRPEEDRAACHDESFDEPGGAWREPAITLERMLVVSSGRANTGTGIG